MGIVCLEEECLQVGMFFQSMLKDVLWETICDICGNNLQQCVGIVSDKFRWVSKLVKNFSKELPLFHNVTENCFKAATFVNNKSEIRHPFLKYQLQEYGRDALLRVPFYGGGEFKPVFQMVEDVLSSARALQLVFLDESCKMVSMEDQTGKGD
ncbi:hypothetical protein Hanom_Chr00s000003g01602381 [Helianthus anomalus]